MAINWFPGHMHKARKEINKVIDKMDIVIEVLDARIPFSSENPLVNQFKASKPSIKILNKSDLADPKITQAWQTYFEKDEQIKTLALSANQDSRAKTISSLCRKLVPRKLSSDKDINAMIMGIPNVGKSTLINGIAGRAIAKVGNEPAVTKRQQKIKLDSGISLSDTPGMLWPKLEPASCGYRLAVTGAIKDTAIEYDDVALFAVMALRDLYPRSLQTRYKLDVLPDEPLALLEAVGAKRGCLRSGGIVDVHQASTILLQDLRSGKLGQITLETPAMMESEMEVFRAMLAAKRASEDSAHKADS